jgi:hypothetical protein
MTVAVHVNCVDYAVGSASIGSGPRGVTYRCTISRVPEHIVAALEAAARDSEAVSLGFQKEEFVLESIEVERTAHSTVQIVGRIAI